MFGQTDAADFGRRLHALRQTNVMADRGIVHAEIVADPSDHHLAGIKTDANVETDSVTSEHILRESAHGVTHVQRGEAGALRVVLMRDRRAKQRHHAVPGELVHGAFETMHAVGRDFEENLQRCRTIARGRTVSRGSWSL